MIVNSCDVHCQNADTPSSIFLSSSTDNKFVPLNQVDAVIKRVEFEWYDHLRCSSDTIVIESYKYNATGPNIDVEKEVIGSDIPSELTELVKSKPIKQIGFENLILRTSSGIIITPKPILLKLK